MESGEIEELKLFTYKAVGYERCRDVRLYLDGAYLVRMKDEIDATVTASTGNARVGPIR